MFLYPLLAIPFNPLVLVVDRWMDNAEAWLVVGLLYGGLLNWQVPEWLRSRWLRGGLWQQRPKRSDSDPLNLDLETELVSYRLMVDHLAVGIVGSDRDGRYRRVNQQFCDLVGYSEAELLTMRFQDLTYPDDLAMDLAAHDRLYAKNGVASELVEKRIVCRDGTVKWISLRIAMITDQAGVPQFDIAVVQDINDHYQMKASLEASDARFQAIVQHSFDMVQLFDEAMTVTYTSPSAETLLGYTSDRLSEEELLTLIHPDDLATVRQARDQLLANPGGSITLEYRMRRADGSWLWLESIATNQLHNPQLRSIVANSRDISERKTMAAQQVDQVQQAQQVNQQLERLVQERTQQLRLAYNFEASLKRITDRVRDNLDEDQILQIAVKELTVAIKAIGCNAAVYSLDQALSTIRYEYTTTCVLNGRVLQMSNFQTGYDQLINGQYFQFCSLKPNPDRGHVAMLACPMQDDQGVLGDLWLVHSADYAFTDLDIRLMQQVANQCAIAIRQARLYQTAQAQVNELERLNALKDDFLSTVSHELRTPVSNIKMSIQMLEMAMAGQKSSGSLAETGAHPLAAKVDRYLKILKDECAREIALINDLLDLSRLDTTTQPVTLETIALKEWIPTLIAPFIERAKNQQQTLRLDLPEQLPLIRTELPSLERILAEFLHNACKYTPAHETITLTIKQWSDDPPTNSGETASATDSTSSSLVQNIPSLLTGDRVSPSLPSSCVFSLEVSNTGVTIAPEELPRVFDKFYRIPKHDPWKYGGTGLGLALVQRLVARLGGAIYVKSLDSTVTFTILLQSMP